MTLHLKWYQKYERSNLKSLYLLNPILPGIWKDVVTWGGAIMAPPDFLLYSSSKSGTNTQNLFPDKIFDI